MANELGISFSPFGDPNDPNNRRDSGSGGVPTPQEAIRVLSFRPPRTVGAFSPIPGPLLNAPGGAAFGGSGLDLEQLLAMLFGQGNQNQRIAYPGLQAPSGPDRPGGGGGGGEQPPSGGGSAPIPSVGVGQKPSEPWQPAPMPWPTVPPAGLTRGRQA